MRSTNTVHVALATAAAVTRECEFLWWLLLCREEYPKEGFGDFGLCFGFCFLLVEVEEVEVEVVVVEMETKIEVEVNEPSL